MHGCSFLLSLVSQYGRHEDFTFPIRIITQLGTNAGSRLPYTDRYCIWKERRGGAFCSRMAIK